MSSQQALKCLTAVLLCFSFFNTSCTHKEELDGNLHVEMKSNIKGFDPVTANDWYMAQVISVAYETLYQYKYLKRPLELEPLLADGMPEISKDGLTYTIHLKKNVLFSDSEVFPNGKGRELVAQDLIYSWKRLADPANQSEGFWVFDNKIKGLNEWRDKLVKGEVTYDTPVEGFQTPDKYTLVIHLTRPYYQLLYQLASPYTAAVPREAVDKYGKDFLNHIVGTGPYIFKEWIRNSHLTFVRNPTWRGETYPTEGMPDDEKNNLLADAGKKIPFADKITFYEIIEDQSRWLNFMKGETDYVEVPKDNFDASIKDHKVSEDMSSKGIRLREDPDPDVTYTGFNMLDPILGKNEYLRQAMEMAQDDDILLKKFYNNEGIVSQSPIPPGIDGYDSNFKNPYKDHNLAKAKELLVKAGYPEGKGLPELQVDIPSSSTERQIAEYFQQAEEQIGIHVKIAMSSWPQFTEKLRDKKAQMFSLSWIADYPDAENFLQLFYGPNESPGNNNANYHNKDFDKLYDEAARLPPGTQRTELYHKMRDIIVKDTPWIVDLHRVHTQLYHDWLKNFKANQVISNPYKYMRVDLDRKKETKAKL